MQGNYVFGELLHRAGTNGGGKPLSDVLAISHECMLFDRGVSEQ
ncbi:MAG: hypothetical protein ACK521_04880 [bacterium]